MIYCFFLASLLSLSILSIPLVIYKGWEAKELSRQKRKIKFRSCF